MKVFNKDVIENFARPGSENVANMTADRACSVAYAALSDMAKTNPFIDPETVEFTLVNEFITGSYCPFSELKIYTTMLAPQLEFNTVKIADNPFKRFRNKIAIAWKSRKRRKAKRTRGNNSAVLITEGKYTMDRFLEDFQDAIVNNVLNTSIVILVNDGIKLLGRDEFGFKVRICPVLRSGETLKVYDSTKRLFKEVKFGNRIENLVNKATTAGENFSTIIRIFNSLFYNLYHYYLDQIFIESIILSVPDSLFGGNIYDSFIKIINYLNLNNFVNIASVVNKNNKLFKEESLCSMSYYEGQKFFRDIATKM